MADKSAKVKSKKSKLILVGLLLLVGLVWGGVWQLPDEKLHLVFCDVGQGDAILIIQGSTQVLIDGGPGNQVLDCLANHLPFWDRTIELVILTHPELDHFGGLIDVVDRYNISQFVLNSIVNDSTAFWEFRDRVLAEGSEIHSLVAGDQINLTQLQFLVLWPSPPLRRGSELVWHPTESTDKEKILGAASSALRAGGGGDLNETSVVVQLVFGDFDALLTGDISSRIEKQLSWENSDPIEVLKVAHHGSKYSTGEEFLARLKPKLGVIMVGKNSFGHPTEEVLGRLESEGVDYFRTDQDGEIELVTDGKSLQKLPKVPTQEKGEE